MKGAFATKPELSGCIQTQGMESITCRNDVSIVKRHELFSFKEVQYHCSSNSCWIVIKNQVYDVTNFLEEHPGGSEIILEHAGRDASSVFHDKGHSAEAYKLIRKYYIGTLREEDRI